MADLDSVFSKYDKLGIFFYTGSVCSSPTVGYLSRFRRVHVPFFESLDGHMLRDAGISRTRFDHTFNEALQCMIENRRSKLLSKLNIGVSEPSADCLVFKWRPFLIDRGALSARRQLFERLNTIPFVIARKSILEQATKILLNENFNDGKRHLQFMAAKMPEEEYEEVAQQLLDYRIAWGPSDIKNLKELASERLNGTREMLRKARLNMGDVPITLMLTENFFRPELEEREFASFFSQKLGLEGFRCQIRDKGVAISSGGQKIRRLGFQSCNVSNFDEIVRRPELLSIESEYQQLLFDSGLVT